MLEQYFRNKAEFDEYLDQTYAPQEFEEGFEKFLQELNNETVS